MAANREQEFLAATDSLISLYAAKWRSHDEWEDPERTEPVWYEHLRVLRWVNAGESKGLVVEKFVQELGVYLDAHSHPKSPVRLFLLSGALSVVMDDKVVLLGPGESTFIPSGTKHAVFSSRDSQCVSIHREEGGLSIEETFDKGGIVNEVFQDIRSRFIAGRSSDSADQEFDILEKIGNYRGFLGGVIVAFDDKDRPEISKSYPRGMGESAIHATNPENFLSAVIHRGSQVWSSNTIYIFYEGTQRDFGDLGTNWYRIVSFDILPEETRKHLMQHFTKEALPKVCVYCPFIVPNNKALANFVGFYQGVEPAGSGNPFLDYISSIQHAGTLIFARLAIRNALDSKHAKIEEPLKKLRTLRKELDSASAAIGQIEAVMNPYYLLLAKQEIELLAAQMAPIFADEKFHDIEGERSWQTVTQAERDERLTKLAWVVEEYLRDVNSVIGKANGVYDSYFGDLAKIGIGEFTGYISHLRQAKALSKGIATLSWVKKSLDTEVDADDTKIGFKPNNEVPPFSFCLAIRSLKAKKVELRICQEGVGNTSLLRLTVNPGEEGDIAELQSRVLAKLKDGQVLSLSDGHTSTALTLIILASQESRAIKERDSLDSLSEGLHLSYKLTKVS